jgi:antitoxin (DNA-binding transcriptional repressor) of toxin-antitoxin stability system
LRNNEKKHIGAIEHGECIELFRKGKPVAILSPARPSVGFRWKRSNPVKIEGPLLSKLLLDDREERF